VNDFSFEDLKPFAGLIVAAGGVIILVGVILDADWLFNNMAHSYNLEKVVGWVNFFGRQPVRIFVGVSSIGMIAFGLFWFWCQLTHKLD